MYTKSQAPAGFEAAGIVRDADGAFIPEDFDNVDWQAYEKWLAIPGNTPTPAPTPAPVVPEEISSRQFFQQIAIDGLISQSDALAYVATGTLPAVFTNAIGQMPAASQFGAKMAIIGANSFSRHNPTTEILGTILGQSAAQLDAIWTAGSQLI